MTPFHQSGVGIEITNQEKLEDSQVSGRLPNLLETYTVYGDVSLIDHAAELTKPTGLRHRSSEETALTCLRLSPYCKPVVVLGVGSL